MNIYVGAVVILVTSLAGFGGFAVLFARGNRQLERLRLLAQLEHAAGQVELEQGYGPFPVDTGPLPLLSELSAGWDALEREQRGWSA